MSKLRLEKQNFFILVILFLLPAYLIKIKYSRISLNLVEMLIITLFLFWIFNKNTRHPIRNTRYEIPVFLIIIGLLLSTIANKNFYAGIGVIKGWFAFPIIFAAIFYESLKKNEKLLAWSLAALFFGGTAVAVEGIYYKLSGLLTYDGRLSIFYDSPNQLAMFLGPVFLIGSFLLLKEKKHPRKIIYGIGLLLIGINLYLAFSFGAWAAILAAFAVLLYLMYAKYERKLLTVFLLVCFLVFLAWAGSAKLKSLEKEGARSSLASREMIWKSSALMIKNNFLFGIGPGNFEKTYLEYQKYFPPYLEWAVPQPHNLFLAFWLESGLAGFIGFIWLLVIFFQDNKKAIENNRLYGALCFAAILYFLIHGFIDTTYWRNDMAVIFWVIIAVNVYLAEFSRDQSMGIEPKAETKT